LDHEYREIFVVWLTAEAALMRYIEAGFADFIKIPAETTTPPYDVSLLTTAGFIPHLSY
jgi:hypothetical protein